MKKHASVSIAKKRLQTLLVSDRVNCTPDTPERLRTELFRTLSKYLDVSKDHFQVRITRSEITISLTGEQP